MSLSFAEFKLAPQILKAVAAAGYSEPTPIQLQAIPPALAGADILGSAQTGTGKTAAFMLPALQRLGAVPVVADCRGPRVLVLTPTRELALQVSAFAQQYGRCLPKISVVNILGGVPYAKQRAKMRNCIDIMVATPGRLIDYLDQGRLDLRGVELLVLDEADRMLDMGFREPVARIVRALPAARQTMLFSATVDESIGSLARGILNNPVRISASAPKVRHEHIEQKLHYVRDLSGKRRLLSQLMSAGEIAQAIIFTATKRDADRLADDLQEQGFDAAALHGNMRQSARTRTIARLRDGSVRFLVATDVAARGIDVRSISHIINFDLPRASEDYVHRIGRTGRAGVKGTAISLAYPSERGVIRRIERYLGHAILPAALPGGEPPARAYGERSFDTHTRRQPRTWGRFMHP